MTSKKLHVAGMKTESEFSDRYLYFIRKYGIPPALWSDNLKSEMSQRIRKVHGKLIIDDQCTDSHSPRENPVELNAIEYIKL
jgi:hypothetical protein